MLRRSPGISAIAILSLGLGVGATSVAFSLIAAVRWRALPYPHADRLVVPAEASSRRPSDEIFTARLATYRLWQERLRTVRPLAAHVIVGGYLTPEGEGDALDLAGEAVSTNLFELLGTVPALGRSFTPEDNRPGADPVVLLSDRLWRSRFRASPALLGRAVRISGVTYTVIGVMPAGMRFEYRSDFWIPLEPYLPRLAAAEGLADPGNTPVRLLGRLAPGVALGEARAEIAAAVPPPPAGQPPWRAALRPLRQDALKYWRSYDLAFGAVALAVLLIACANLAGLLLVRAIGRRREFAVRSALGASPRRLASQLAAESLAIAALGGAAGCFASRWSAAVSATLQSSLGILPTALESRLGSPSTAVSIAVTAAVALLVSVAPASRFARAAPQRFLRGAGVAQESRASRRRAQHLFVALQIAGAVVLISVGGAAARRYREFEARSAGGDGSQIIYSHVEIPRGRPGETSSQASAALRERLRELPGIAVVGAQFRELASRQRIGGEPSGVTVTRAAGSAEVSASVGAFAVDSPFFEANGIRFVRGRNFGAAEDAPGAGAAIVSELAAKTWWPGEDPIGRRLKFGRPGDPAPWATVVGVVENSLEPDPISVLEDPRPAVFVPLAEGLGDTIELFLRARGPASPALVGDVRRTLRQASPDALPFLSTRDAIYRETLDPIRRNVVGILFAAACGLMLAGIGISGVLAHAVERRRQEIGVRMALGASRASLSGLVLGEGMRMALAGLGTGLLAAFAALRVLQGLFFGGLRVDLATIAAVCVLLAALTLIAGALPLRRALRVDPLTSMRSE
jgi:predicted permease